MSQNPEGHSPHYWNKHPEVKAKADAVATAAALEDRVPQTKPERKNRGADCLFGGFALLVEFLAVWRGEAWLGWGAAALFVGAFHEYTKEFFGQKRWFVRWGARLVIIAALGMGTSWAIRTMEKQLRARIITTPKVKISLTQDKTLVLDNSKGDGNLADFQINARAYYLNGLAAANNHAQIDKAQSIGGDLDFDHFGIAAGEIRRIDLTTGRYGTVLAIRRMNTALQVFDASVHYVCLRITFTNEGSGERFVHYVVLSPYVGGFDLAEHPEAAGAAPAPAGTEGYPFSIARIIKADARAFYGTELREHQP